MKAMGNLDGETNSWTIKPCRGENPKRHLPETLIITTAVCYSNNTAENYTKKSLKRLLIYKVARKHKLS